MTETTSDMHIGGRRTRAHGTEAIEVINPTTEEVIGSIVDGDAADVDSSVQEAKRAFSSSEWRDLTADERGDKLIALAEILERNADAVGELVTRQNGMPLRTFGGLRGAAYSAARAYRYYGQLAKNQAFEDLRVTRTSSTLVRREPVGVVGIIAPWNGPQSLVAWKLGPALAAGCTAVIKPAPETSLDGFLLLDAVYEAGFPAGTVNLVTGGRETGAMLVAHPGVDKVGFTGSSAAGRIIAAKCGSLLKPVTLELGGKSAAILLDDADLDLFSSLIPRISAPNTGQVCYSCTRILTPVTRYDETVDAVVTAMRGGVVGDPLQEDTTFGPLVAERQRARVESYIAKGNSEGAKLVYGGGRPHLDRGFFVEPTVFANVNNEMTIAREEIFGPVLSVIPYGTEEEAVAIANDSEYGLGGSVFTADTDRGLEVARQVETGTIGLNGYAIALDSPFGGVKASGLGRELGPEGLMAYIRYKSIYNVPQPA